MQFCLWKILPTKNSFRNIWSNVYTYQKNLALNNLQSLIYHKIQPTNQPTWNSEFLEVKNCFAFVN